MAGLLITSRAKNWLDKMVKLYPDVANKPDVSVDATCHIVREKDDKVRAYTSIRCEDLAGHRACSPMVFMDKANTCTKFGYAHEKEL